MISKMNDFKMNDSNKSDDKDSNANTISNVPTHARIQSLCLPRRNIKKIINTA